MLCTTGIYLFCSTKSQRSFSSNFDKCPPSFFVCKKSCHIWWSANLFNIVIKSPTILKWGTGICLHPHIRLPKKINIVNTITRLNTKKLSAKYYIFLCFAHHRRNAFDNPTNCFIFDRKDMGFHQVLPAHGEQRSVLCLDNPQQSEEFLYLCINTFFPRNERQREP